MAGWTHSLQVDLLGTIYATRWAIEAMRRSGGGSIVNIASISALWHGRKTPGGFPGYDVAKLGVIRLTTGGAKDVAKEGIRGNCLAAVGYTAERLLVADNSRRRRGRPHQSLASPRASAASHGLRTGRTPLPGVRAWRSLSGVAPGSPGCGRVPKDPRPHWS